MVLNIVIIFIAGLILDLLVAKYTIYIVSKKRGMAAFLSILITVANFVFLTLILNDGLGNGIFNILAFASGGGVGTFLSMKRA
ncbi:hypothetical protein MUP95_02280 [bacterium]|nr:hypothetical protein [bacterium]